MDAKTVKRYKFYVWAFIIVTLASYVNSIIDIIKLFI